MKVLLLIVSGNGTVCDRFWPNIKSRMYLLESTGKTNTYVHRKSIYLAILLDLHVFYLLVLRMLPFS